MCCLAVSFAILPIKAFADAPPKSDQSQRIVWGNIATAAPGLQNISVATCPHGYVVTGGGYQLLPTFYPLAEFFVSQNAAIDPQTWQTTLYNSTSNGSNSIKFWAEAICHQA
jgi:hypothetical protein